MHPGGRYLSFQLMIIRLTHHVCCLTVAAAVLAAPIRDACGQVQTRSQEIGQPPPKEAAIGVGRFVFAAVGIDDYHNSDLWKTLDNAVNDVEQMREALVDGFGFESRDEWILTDEAATAVAIRALLDELRNELGPADNLIFLYAGHGAELRDVVGGEEVGRRGYIVPVEVKAPVDAAPSQYVGIEGFLEAIARLRAGHVLVILDSCYSGMALENSFKTRGGNETQQARDLIRRVSRRVLTSAQSDQLAADGGADFPRNSLFTGWMVEGLRRAVEGGGPDAPSPDTDEDGWLTMTELYSFVRGRVGSDSGSRQTPDFGAFELDQRGELVLTLDRDPFEELFEEAWAVYEEDKIEQFHAAVEAALEMRPEGPRASYLRYLRALVDGEDGQALLALRELSAFADEGVEIPMSLGSLNNQLRQAERFCAKVGCDLEGG